MKYITVKLTEEQAQQIIRILDYGMAYESDYYTGKDTTSPEDKRFNAFLTRIQTKLQKALADI